MAGLKLGRRTFLAGGVGLLAAGLLRPAAATPRRIAFRAIAIDNVNTGEALEAIYWADDYYIPQTLRQIAWVLRDFHSGDVHPIDPNLLDLLARLQERLRTSEPFMVTSGYRSPRTNAALAETTEGVAAHSLHMQGMAVDISLRQRSLASLHAAALELGGGGVGYYPRHGFVHVDVGPVRRWEGGNGSVAEPAHSPGFTLIPEGSGRSPAPMSLSAGSSAPIASPLRSGAGLAR